MGQGPVLIVALTRDTLRHRFAIAQSVTNRVSMAIRTGSRLQSPSIDGAWRLAGAPRLTVFKTTTQLIYLTVDSAIACWSGPIGGTCLNTVIRATFNGLAERRT